MEEELAVRWEVDQDEVGRPVIRHRHPPVAVQAQLSHDGNGVARARCPRCGDQLELNHETKG
jgi:hypothetical protein